MYQNYPSYMGNPSYPNYQSYPGSVGHPNYYIPSNKENDDRFFPFLAPFLLGGLAGAAIARPGFGFGGYGAPCCPPYPVPYPYPYAPYPYRPY